MSGVVRALVVRTLMAAALVAVPLGATAPSPQEANKKIVVDFYEAAINRKDFEAASKFLGPRYTQHNLNAADGPEGLKAEPGQRGSAIVDIFKRVSSSRRRARSAPTCCEGSAPGRRHPGCSCAARDRAATSWIAAARPPSSWPSSPSASVIYALVAAPNFG